MRAAKLPFMIVQTRRRSGNSSRVVRMKFRSRSPIEMSAFKKRPATTWSSRNAIVRIKSSASLPTVVALTTDVLKYLLNSAADGA